MKPENANDMIRWLEVLSNGYVKPDINKQSSNVNGVVRDTKKFFPYINSINSSLCDLFDIAKPELDEHDSGY